MMKDMKMTSGLGRLVCLSSVVTIDYARASRAVTSYIFFQDVLFCVFCVIKFIQKSYYSISSSVHKCSLYLTTKARRIPRGSFIFRSAFSAPHAPRQSTMTKTRKILRNSIHKANILRREKHCSHKDQLAIELSMSVLV